MMTASHPAATQDHAHARFVSSALFDRLFREGMALVEETAAYLDGPGRNASKALNRTAALAYAGESMRLTTRLMQMASWLMVHRAVREGEIAPAEAREDKHRLRRLATPVRLDGSDALPTALLELMRRAERLYARLLRFDEAIFDRRAMEAENPVMAQLQRLRAGFEGA